MGSNVQDIVKRGENEFTVAGISGDFALDRAVVKALPEGTQILSANAGGASAWAITARLDVMQADGTKKRWYLKCATEDLGKIMIQGEYESMKEMYKFCPDSIPEPFGFGAFEHKDPPTYFYIGQYLDMSHELPDPVRFNKILADLHRRSVSPTGKFGFHIQSCHGKFGNHVEWDSSWVSFFTNMIGRAMEINKSYNVPWPELDKVCERTLTHVIPAVLGPLESGGRSIKPCLIHGDLWEENTGTEFDTGNIYLFDAGCFYAHNEMEIAMWRGKRNRLSSKTYKREYLRNMPPSEPAEMWDDRNRLYNVKFELIHSALHVGAVERQHAFNSMKYLIDQYAPFPPDEKLESTEQPTAMD